MLHAGEGVTDRLLSKINIVKVYICEDLTLFCFLPSRSSCLFILSACQLPESRECGCISI